MKEYIEKRELIEQIEHERDMWGEDYDAEQILGDIEDMQTVTQADIESLAYNRGARAFAENMKSKIKTCAVLRMKDIDEILEEMWVL